MAEPTYLKNADGTIDEIDPRDLADAAAAGESVATPDDVAAARLQEQYGGVAGHLGAAAGGVAGGLSFGASDTLARGLGFDALLNAERANPYTTTGGNLASLLVPGLGEIEGLGMAGRAAKALGTPLRLVGEAGEAAGGLAQAAGLGKLGGLVARGAGDGLAFGAGGAATEAALGDHDLNAEMLWAGAKQGALFGGLANGVLGAGISKLGGEGGTPSLFERVVGDHLGVESEEGVGARLADDVANAKVPTADDLGNGGAYRMPGTLPSEQEAYIGAKARTEQEAELLRRSAQQNALSSLERETAATSRVRETAKDFDQLEAAHNTLAQGTFGEGKTQQIKALAKETEEGAALANGERTYQRVNEVIGAMRDDLRRTGSKQVLDRIDRWSGAIRKAVDDGAPEHTIFNLTDEMQREIGRHAGFGKRPVERTFVEKQFEKLYHEIRPQLHDEVAFGPAARAQKAVNKATTDMLAMRETYGSNFLDRGHEVREGNRLFRGDPGKIESFFRKVVGPSGDLAAESLRNHLTEVQNYAKAALEHYELAPAQRKAAEEILERAPKLEKSFAQQAHEASLDNQIRHMRDEERAHGLGGVLGAVSDVATRPLHTLDKLAAIRGTVDSVRSKLRGAVRSLLGGSEGGKAARAVPKSSKGVQDEFRKATSDVADLVTNEQVHADLNAAKTAHFAAAAPKTAAAVSMVSARAAAWLAAQMPGKQVQPYSLTPHLDKPVVSDSEAAAYVRKVNAVRSPLSVVKRLQHGTVTQDEVDAIAAVYPKLYDNLRMTTLEELSDRKKPVGYVQKLQLGVLLRMPTDPTMAPEFLRAVSQAYASPTGASQPPPAPSASALAPLYQSDADRIAAKE